MVFAIMFMEKETPVVIGFTSACSRHNAWRHVSHNKEYIKYGLDQIELCKLDKKGAYNATDTKKGSQQEGESSNKKAKEDNSSSSQSLKQTYLQLGPSSL